MTTNKWFRWEQLLGTDAPQQCCLKGALFTTYDRADARLMAEHLLPFFLKLSREPADEDKGQQYFVCELDRRLKQLHDKLVVVSSAALEEPTDTGAQSAAYSWIWRSIRCLTVGRTRNAVQHAKLWLLHWGPASDDGPEYVEIVISSTNLTMAAFKGQIQAIWKVCIGLRPEGSKARLDRWGILPQFLEKLAASAGEPERLDPFIDLLARADCPKDIVLLASAPGTYSRENLRRTPWGAAGLAKIRPSGRGVVKVSILSPYIGSWSTNAVKTWCAKFEGLSNRIELVWIDKDHPWARASRWILPKTTLKTLTEAGAAILQLGQESDSGVNSQFHKEHRPGDDRWSHAKVYSFKRGNSRRLLLTSANFSTSAWGTENREGTLTIENFELGVCILQADWPLGGLELFEDCSTAAIVEQLPSRGAATIAWARAVWNGKEVHVDCRLKADAKLKGKIQSGGAKFTPIAGWAIAADGRLYSADVPWSGVRQPPSLIQLECGPETVEVTIFDERPVKERDLTIPTEVNQDVAQQMRDELLFEEYGGRVASDGDGGPETAKRKNKGKGTVPENYDVPVFVLARRHLAVVDKWAERVEGSSRLATAEFEREILRRDGQSLIEAFGRQPTQYETSESSKGIGASLAAEEMNIRLKHFVEA
jgi:hypothetical protein